MNHFDSTFPFNYGFLSETVIIEVSLYTAVDISSHAGMEKIITCTQSLIAAVKNGMIRMYNPYRFYRVELGQMFQAIGIITSVINS